MLELWNPNTSHDSPGGHGGGDGGHGAGEELHEAVGLRLGEGRRLLLERALGQRRRHRRHRHRLRHRCNIATLFEKYLVFLKNI